MNRLLLSALALGALMVSCGNNDNPRERHLFTDNWFFALGDSAQAYQAEYDDDDWRQLDLPHDWAIEGDFSESNPSGTGGGALPGGIGWYRKHVKITSSDLEGRVRIGFDGVYMNSTVYVNGEEVGHRPYGYVSFEYDITDYLQVGDNVIAVKVDNSDQPNSRWYSGCGIYRNVWLTKVSDVHVAQYGVFAYAKLVNDVKATIKVETKVENSSDSHAFIRMHQYILDKAGEKVAEVENEYNIGSESDIDISQELVVEKPHLWNLNDTYQYRVVTDIYGDDDMLDRYEIPLGIRTFYFDDTRGFILNDSTIKINGVCLHHDLGCLGAAVNRRAIERQLQILQEMGCNGIRCSHNPPAPELLELCDSMGFIVMDEAFDMWRKKKTQKDYARFFDEWHERDLTDFVKRDRNHPSIFMWSIGNEVLEQWTDANADTLDLASANLLLNMQRDPESLEEEGEEMSVNSLLCRHLCDIVRRSDPSRPITAGNNEPEAWNHLFRSGALDIIGYNYHNAWIDDVQNKFPHKPFIITESNSALMTRGFYMMPSDQELLWPVSWDKPFFNPSFSCSSYDNCHTPWGSTHEETMAIVKNNPFVSGQFIWTGFDYIGEPTPYGWPARSSYFGVVDLAGFPKDIYYMYKSEWTDEQVLHLFPHWNWQEGQEVDVWCYYNRADEVELYVNGESKGVRMKEDDQFHVMWRAPYEPGELKVVARQGGMIIGETVRNTAQDPYAIRLTADRGQIVADGRDLSFVTVEVVDSLGNVCPNADNEITFDIDGTGVIAGVDNGSPISLERFKDNKRKAFYGKCLVVIQSKREYGNIRLVAESEGLEEAELIIHCLPQEMCERRLK
ncbi:MAG: glycoside hydrolase family 2 TIM barrel-domain containing protein [Bacteroidia bacterium]|nr:glycoside hydrolase family 2 TIM barrel-domain containing protein [Bacteroidia bacterium]